MELTCTFSYQPCQTCSAKIHCEQCGETIAETLRRIGGVETAEVNLPAKTMRVTGPDIDEDAIEDAMDAIGVFL